MKNLFLTIKVQDGENEHTNRVLHTTNANDIWFAAQRYVASYYSYGEHNGDWWEFRCGTIAAKLQNVMELTSEQYDLMSSIFNGSGVKSTPEVPACIARTDWQLLGEQKQSLLKVIDNCDDVPVLEHLEGILVFIDAIQDYACDDLGLGEALVFPNLNGSPWNEIQNDFEDEGIVYVDAYTSNDEDEEGKTIAKVNVKTKEIEYLDERAKTDSFAQEAIKEVLDRL